MLTQKATGSFEVVLTPVASDEPDANAGIGRLTITKRFEGDLTAESRGEMLAMNGEAPGSAGYVAIERVVGTLLGREGAFALQHDGRMTPATSSLSIRVVPGSGSGDLAGIDGTMTIEVADGRHQYAFEYTLSD
jgi:hypothetical protein